MSLPQMAPDWVPVFADEALMRGAASAIAEHHGLGTETLQRCEGGSLPVYAIGEDHVLKLYPPHETAHAEVEARVLALIDGRLPLPTPAPRATGSFDGWPYLLMSRLHGTLLAAAWPTLPRAQQLALCEHLGIALATLHALDTTTLADLPPPHWATFMQAQRVSAVQRQRERGLAQPWLEQIDAFLQRWAPSSDAAQVLLHTEVMREHLLVEGAAYSGLFDFEPAMLGPREYEFASVGLFVSAGDAQALQRLLRAYGYAESELDATLSCRFMAQALLHRYANLPWYLRRLPCPGATTLEQLAEHWWALPQTRR